MSSCVQRSTVVKAVMVLKQLLVWLDNAVIGCHSRIFHSHSEICESLWISAYVFCGGILIDSQVSSKMRMRSKSRTCT